MDHYYYALLKEFMLQGDNLHYALHSKETWLKCLRLRIPTNGLSKVEPGKSLGNNKVHRAMAD